MQYPKNELFTEIDSEQAATLQGGNAFLQVRGLISGIMNGGWRNPALNALAGQSIVLTGGLQRLPSFWFFRPWW